MTERYLVGNWSEKLNAFWMGANNCEFIAWKGSHQIFVYLCDEYPSPPSMIYQHTKRIETLEDFNDALDNQKIFDVTYKEQPKITLNVDDHVKEPVRIF